MTDSSPRRATAADVAAIEDLIDQAFGKYVARIGRRPAPMDADYAGMLDTANVWVLSSPAGLVGALVTHARDDHLLVETIAVAPGAQGRGYGPMLLERAEQDAHEAGFTQIRLCTNAAMTENLRFYPRHGYVETRRAQQDGFDRVFFTKALPPRV